MDEKTQLLPPPNGVQPAPRPANEPVLVYYYTEEDVGPSACSRVARVLIRLALITSILYLLLAIDFTRALPRSSKPPTTSPPADLTERVPLEVHIMSKCPDARDCLKQLIVPAMEEVVDKVDFRLSYIAGVHKHDTDISCMHGPTECLGNIIELCAAELYPDPKIFLGFTMCMSDEYASIPQRELVKGCALEHGMEFEKLNECASRDDGAYGSELLRKSAERTKAANVTYSCTVRLDEQVRCIRDGGQWKDCPGGSDVADLVRDVDALAS